MILGELFTESVTPYELGLKQSFFCFHCRHMQKGLACDIASQSIMVKPLTFVRCITTLGCIAIFHAALLGLGRCPFSGAPLLVV
jgi:hypothetical protein